MIGAKLINGQFQFDRLAVILSCLLFCIGVWYGVYKLAQWCACGVR